MIGNSRPLIEVGLHYLSVKGVWLMYWRGGLYDIPPGMDRGVYLTDHLLSALRGWSADYNPGLYAGVPNSHNFKARYQIQFRISQYDLFEYEKDDYVIDRMFNGERRVYSCLREKLSWTIQELIREIDLEILQMKLSEP
jgi:hypothetical protein